MQQVGLKKYIVMEDITFKILWIKEQYITLTSKMSL